METIVKQTRELGTSAGVLLPRRWLNKQVVVTLHSPSGEDIAIGVLKILFEHKLNEGTKGIYLYGSYAREDQDFDSDIDILVLTKNTNKLIKSNNYEILLVSEKSFSDNLSRNLTYLSILKEVKPLINKELIEKYTEKKIKLDLKELIKEIKRVIKINEESILMCKENKQNIPDGIVYSMVLRLRELYLIKSLLQKKPYKKEEFLKIVGEKAYSAYNRVKRDENEINNLPYDEVKPLADLTSKWLKELKD